MKSQEVPTEAATARSRPQTAERRVRLVLGLATGAMMVIAAGVGLAWRLDERLTRQAADARELARLGRIALSLAVDRETGIRGYLVTRDSVDLAPELEARKRLPTVLDSIDLLRHRLGIGRGVTPMRDALARWEEAFAEPVLAGRRVPASGKVEFDGIRVAADGILVEKDALYTSSLELSRRAGRLGFAIVLLASLLLGAMLWVLREWLARQQTLLQEQQGVLGTQASQLDDTNEDLRRMLARQKALFRALSDYVMVLRRDGTVEEVIATAALARPLVPGSLAGRSVLSLLASGEALRVQQTGLAVLEDGTTRELQTRFATEMGESHVRCSLSRIDDERLLCVARDITAQEASEEARAESDRRLRSLMSTLPGIAYRCRNDENWTTEVVSDGVQVVTGYSPDDFLSGRIKGFSELIHPEDRDRVWREVQTSLAAGDSFDLRYRVVNRDGSVRFVEEFGRLVRASADDVEHLEGFILDVTERHALEHQLHQSQKMEAVGQLAGGVAHDFNNLLTVITSYTGLLLMDMPAGDPQRQDLEEVQAAADRAAALTRQLLAFSRQQVLKPQLISLNTAVADMERMLRRLLPETIELSSDLAGDLWYTNVDRGQLEQVLLNLVVNARDAMPDGGTLRVTTRNVIMSDTSTAQAVVPSGEYVELAVRDTGIGMDQTTRDRIFEPFYTTKGVGRGTGLGLSTVFGIVSQSRGEILVDTAPGAGTTFRVVLPRAMEIDSEGRVSGPVVGVGSEAILLVEDEAPVRVAARRALERLGYSVVEASNGAEALRLAEATAVEFEAVLCDVVMPVMGGRALARQLRALRPKTPIIFMSGYTDDVVFRDELAASGMPFLEKPFSPATLGAIVRQVLDSVKSE